ncbi:FAST kinase domain-containing protein 4 isoform X2 [Thalassophryne amazonica]|nr:FAST kinase domain-containing protein 4 isoform X2 [Thalassophryne amazonica]
MCERMASRKHNIPELPLRTKLDELVQKSTSPEDVLLAWAQHGGNGNTAACALKKWAQLVQKTKGETEKRLALRTDARLQDMMDTVSQQVFSVWNGSLVSLLLALWTINVPMCASLLNSVETEVLWRIRRLSFNQLVSVVSWGAGRPHQQDLKLVNAALKQLELRWTEISNAKSVTLLMCKGQSMSAALMDRLEDKALELSESFTAEEIRRVCVCFATQNRRSVPLLRAFSYHLLQKPSSEFTAPLIIDMAYVYGKLSFHQTLVFQRLASELLPRVKDLNSADVTRCAKSLGFLKWLHLPLFEAFIEHYLANSDAYTVSQLCNLLLTLARLNFQPSTGEEFYNKVHFVLKDALSSLEPFLRTDTVWSLCVLQQAKPQYLIPLVQQEHATKLSEGSPAQGERYRQKLLHIAATLHLEHPGSAGTTAFPLSLDALPAPGGSSTLSPLQSSLRESLHQFVGENSKALRTGVDTLYGWTIDGEMILDRDNKPVDITMMTAPHLPGGGGNRALPAEARRLAFLALEYPNYVLKSKDLLGRFVMMKRHLQLAGFITVEVPYYEWQELNTDWQKLAYLKDKMGKAVAEDMAK